MKLRVIIAVLAFQALCLFAYVMLYAAHVSQIFVLHSYSQEYAWTRGQHEGFIQALTADAQVEHLVSTEYLDTKRRAYDEAYATEMARHLLLKYADYKPAAIYVTDDNALLFARDHLFRVFPGVPVFFSGVNDYSVQSSLDPALFTGVFEHKEFVPNIEWLLRIDKDANDLVFVGDGSNTYSAIERELRNGLKSYRLRTTFIAEKRLDRVLARLRDLPGKYIFLTTLGGMTDENGQLLPLRDIMGSLARTERIVISMEDAYIIEGVLGGYVTSGRQQGMNAAQLLLAYLRGKPIVDLPPMLKSPNAWIFDDSVLQKRGIVLPGDIRSQAVLLNPHRDFYERHRSLIIGVLIALAAALFFVITVSLVMMSRKKRQISNALQQLAASETRLHAILDAEPECVKIIGPDGTLQQMNQAGLAMIEAGDNPAQVLGHQVADIVVPEHRDAFIALTRRVLKGDSGSLEFEIVGLKGTRRWLETHAVPLREASGEIVLLGVTRDITERKKAEEERDRLNEQVEERNKELQQVVYTVSHDLRSPLINIQGYSRMLILYLQKVISTFKDEGAAKEEKEKAAFIVDKEIPESVGYINASVSKMDSLLSAMLRLSRTIRSELQIKEIDMNTLVSDVLKTFDFQTKEAGAGIGVSVLPSCFGDESQINQVFSNLISNALKYHSPERAGVINISGREEDGQTVYCVEDNGVGIPSEEQDRIFDIFYRVHDEAVQGEGLGLAIVRKIIERHGGRIWVESEVSKGSRFYMALPNE